MSRFDSFVEIARRMASIKSHQGVSNGAQSSVTTLAFVRLRVAKAEAELESAREAMRIAADKAGIERAGLFAESLFVGRATAEKWTDQARSEGYEAGKELAREEIIRVMMRSKGLDYDTEMRKIRAESAARMACLNEEGARWRAKMEKAGFFAACDAGEFTLAGRIYFEQFPEHFSPSRSGDLARQILTAAKRRDSDPSNERPSPEGLAKKIINSGRRRRGEKEFD
jgi:hypothetical protein